MKEIRQEPGSIYMLRVSIPEVFGIFESGEPQISSFASCVSSSSGKTSAKSSALPKKPKRKRPRIVLFTHSGSLPLLLLPDFTVMIPLLLMRMQLLYYPN